MGNSPKISSSNFAHMIMSERWHTMQILYSIATVGASPKIGKISPLCNLFWLSQVSFSWCCSHVELLDRFSRFMAQTTYYHTRRCLSGVRMMGYHIWGKYAPNAPPPKTWAGIGNFKPKRWNTNIAISHKLQVQSKPTLRIKLRPTIALLGWSNIIHIKSNMAAGRHLEKQLWSHSSIKGRLVFTKFGRLMQNDDY